jgi:antirestriction protein ArdC
MVKTSANDLFERITARIVAGIEEGAGDWRMPWRKMAEVPESVDRRPYRGMNALWLAMEAMDHGWDSGIWGTYDAWKRHRAQVRKGEKNTPVVLWRPVTSNREGTDGEPEEHSFLVARVYHVFAAEQVDGAEALLARRQAGKLSHEERLDAADAYFHGYVVPIHEGGSRAYYSWGKDEIHVPRFEAFEAADDFYSTVAHEAVHSTGHESRLKREFGKRFGDEAYAAEELVAELGAAFWCAQSGLSQAPRLDHAQYLSHWLNVLRTDAKALLTVTSKAQAAIDFLNTHTVAPIAAVPEAA